MILNLILVPIPSIGVNGAAWASVACHVVAFTIAITALIKHIRIKINISKFVIKPAMATFIMGGCSYFVYNLLTKMVAGRLATIIAIIVAVIIYVFTIAALRIFSKEEILNLPKGEKIYKFLVKIKLY